MQIAVQSFLIFDLKIASKWKVREQNEMEVNLHFQKELWSPCMFVQNGDEMKIIFFPKKVVISVRREIGSQKKESLFLILISRLEKGGDQKE